MLPTSTPSSLTTTASIGRYVCAAILDNASPKRLGLSLVRTMTETRAPLPMGHCMRESYVQTGSSAQRWTDFTPGPQRIRCVPRMMFDAGLPQDCPGHDRRESNPR